MRMSLPSNARPSRVRPWLFGALALAAIGGLGAVSVASLAQQSAPTGSAIPAGANFTSWTDNGKDGQRVLQLVRGDMPVVEVAVSGVVKTDTNCDPDPQGVSHCHNVIKLADGGEIEVVHNHAMMIHDCLAPGQKLSLTRLEAGWIVAKDAR